MSKLNILCDLKLCFVYFNSKYLLLFSSIKVWPLYLLVVIITLSDASDFYEEKSEYMNSLSGDFDKAEIISTMKESTNGVENDLSLMQDTGYSGEFSTQPTQRFPNAYQRIRRTLEVFVNTTVQSELSDASARSNYINGTQISMLKMSNDSNSVDTQTSHAVENNNANVIGSSTVSNKMNPYIDEEFDDINNLLIVLGVVSVIILVFLVAAVSTVVMKRKQRQADEINLSSQYTALLD